MSFSNLAITIAKQRIYVSFVWAALVVFSIVGIFLGKESAPYICVGLATMWVLGRIIGEAIDGWAYLKILNAEPPKNESD